MEIVIKYIKRKFGKGFTFLVVPNSSGANVKSISIPFSLVLVVIAMIAFNTYIFFGYTTQIWTIFNLKQANHFVRVKNHKLLKEQREVKPILRKSFQMVDELNRMKKEQVQINTIWKSIQQKGGRVITQASRGVSGRIHFYTITPRQNQNENVKTSLEELKYNLSQLNGYMKEEKEQQQQLLSELTAYERLLDHTPSKWPAATTIISWFGWRFHPIYKKMKEHEGVDIVAAYGTKIRAAADGAISYAEWESGYGFLVKVNHGYGYETRYGHNSRIIVKVGQEVKKGQVISLSGSSGDATGPHLHYEVRINGEPINPIPFLRN